jgi:hypothetical protein
MRCGWIVGESERFTRARKASWATACSFLQNEWKTSDARAYLQDYLDIVFSNLLSLYFPLVSAGQYSTANRRKRWFCVSHLSECGGGDFQEQFASLADSYHARIERAGVLLLAGREEKRPKHHLSQVRVRHDVQQGGKMLTKQRCQTQTVTGFRSRSAAMSYNLTREAQSILDEHQNNPPSFSVQLYHDNWTLNSGPKFLYNSPAYTVRTHLLVAISHHSLVMFRLCLTTSRQIGYP